LRHLATWLAVPLIALALAPAAVAADEQGDAGDVPGTAQDLTQEPVQSIAGTLATGDDSDLFRICLTGGRSFSATTVGGTGVDTQLFLFDASGIGIYAHDGDDTTKQSTLPAGDALTPEAPGEYILGISAYDRDPQSASGPIFNNVAFLTGANGRGAADPVESWAGLPRGSGAYTISLTGVRSCDSTAPTIDLRSPAEGAAYPLGQEVLADYECGDEPGGSGIVSCVGDVADGAPVDTSTVGAKQFRVTATDGAGNTASSTVGYEVVLLYDFGGFRPPVEDYPAINRWVAGDPVPVRFSLGGFKGLDVLSPGYPQMAEVECGAGEQPESGRPARSVWWSNGLRYGDGEYSYLWRTQRDWAGGCRQFLLKLKDGPVHRAEFRFVRTSWGIGDDQD
jgi:hypothetical protein